MKAMIFAAGMGTRLKPLTDSMPKALVPIAGRPLLAHVIEKLKSAGFNEFVINVHHFADQIREYVRECGNFGVEVAFSDETDFLRETGGGIRHAATLLNDGEPFFVHNVDILSNLDIEAFYKAHCEAVSNSTSADGGKGCSEEEVLATLLVSDRKTERYLLFDNDDNLVGWMNIKSGEVKSPFRELQRTPSSESGMWDYDSFLQEYGLRRFAFAGIHAISPQIFRLMGGEPDKFGIIPFYISCCNRYKIKAFVAKDLKIVDVGKLDSLQMAEELASEL